MHRIRRILPPPEELAGARARALELAPAEPERLLPVRRRADGHLAAASEAHDGERRARGRGRRGGVRARVDGDLRARGGEGEGGDEGPARGAAVVEARGLVLVLVAEHAHEAGLEVDEGGEARGVVRVLLGRDLALLRVERRRGREGVGVGVARGGGRVDGVRVEPEEGVVLVRVGGDGVEDAADGADEVEVDDGAPGDALGVEGCGGVQQLEFCGERNG